MRQKKKICEIGNDKKKYVDHSQKKTGMASSPSIRSKQLISTTYWAVFLGSLILVMSLLQTGENGYALLDDDNEHRGLLTLQGIVCVIGLLVGGWALLFWKFETVTQESINTFALTVAIGAAYTLFVIVQQHRTYRAYAKSDRAEHLRHVMYGNVILFSMLVMLMILLVFYGWN